MTKTAVHLADSRLAFSATEVARLCGLKVRIARRICRVIGTKPPGSRLWLVEKSRLLAYLRGEVAVA